MRSPPPLEPGELAEAAHVLLKSASAYLTGRRVPPWVRGRISRALIDLGRFDLLRGDGGRLIAGGAIVDAHATTDDEHVG